MPTDGKYILLVGGEYKGSRTADWLLLKDEQKTDGGAVRLTLSS